MTVKQLMSADVKSCREDTDLATAMTPASIRAQDVMSRDISTCSNNADVRDALAMLKERRVRRLPVVDDHDRLAGVISMNDLATRAECRRGAEVPGDEFLETFRVICTHTSALTTA